MVMMIIVLSVTNISLGMTVNRKTSIVRITEEQRRIIQIIESQRRNNNKCNMKFLEHSCFKGESLRFQNEFFSSDYTSLPTQQEAINHLILRDENQLGAILGYHHHYRKLCYNVLVK